MKSLFLIKGYFKIFRLIICYLITLLVLYCYGYTEIFCLIIMPTRKCLIFVQYSRLQHHGTQWTYLQWIIHHCLLITYQTLHSVSVVFLLLVVAVSQFPMKNTDRRCRKSVLILVVNNDNNKINNLKHSVSAPLLDFLRS